MSKRFSKSHSLKRCLTSLKKFDIITLVTPNHTPAADGDNRGNESLSQLWQQYVATTATNLSFSNYQRNP